MIQLDDPIWNKLEGGYKIPYNPTKAIKNLEVNKNTINKLHFFSTTGILKLNNKNKKCIVKDVSFSGMKLIAAGNEKDFINKNISIKLPFADNITADIINGAVIRTDSIGDSKDFVSLGILLDNSSIPFDYKNVIADFLSSTAEV